MQYEVGKTYHEDGVIEVCSNGLHFCTRLTDVFDYYEHGKGNRFFEVEAGGEIKTERRKSAASELAIIRELTGVEINRAVYGYGYGYGDGNGYGYGDGNGYGYGYGDGNGDGNGYGYGYGYGNGYGNGDGYGYGNGYGNGNIQKVLLFA